MKTNCSKKNKSQTQISPTCSVSSSPCFLPQKAPARLPLQDPDEPQHVSAVPQHGLPIGRLARQSANRLAVSVRGRLSALLPVDLLHLDGAGVHPHVHRSGQSLQHLHTKIHPQVLHRWMG